MPIHFRKTYKKTEWWVLGLIILVAFVFRFQHIQSTPPGLYPDEAINGNNAIHALETGDYKLYYPENNGREGLYIALQAQSIRIFGNTSWALRVVSALFGTLTVLGLYLLTKRLFNWQIAAMSSFFLAVSFWHVLFSRIGFRAILAPFLLVWGLYFFWKGKVTTKLFDFAMSGIFLGLGFYTYIAYRIMPLAIILTLVAYWYAIKKDFGHEKYLHIRNQILRGFAMTMLVTILVALPIGWYYYTNPADFLGRTSQISVFSSESPFQSLVVNTGKTLGMFNFSGDQNWRHNFSGNPQLFWPIGVFFVLGFIRSWIKLFKTRKTHGHFASVQVLLLSWFILGLLPAVFSSEGIPHALRVIIVAPVCMIFAGEGLWWLYDFTRKWYKLYDSDDVTVHNHKIQENTAVATFAVLALLFGIMINEYRAYFNDWSKNPETASAFDQRYTDIAVELNSLPIDTPKYVVANAGGVLVAPPDDELAEIPMPAQSIMYLTDTWTVKKQQEKNLFYLTEEQYSRIRLTRDAKVFFLNPNQ